MEKNENGLVRYRLAFHNRINYLCLQASSSVPASAAHLRCNGRISAEADGDVQHP